MTSSMMSLPRLALACAATVSCRSPSPVVTAPPARPVAAAIVDEVTVNHTDDQGAWAAGRWSVVRAVRGEATVRRTQQAEWASHSRMRVEAATTFDYDGDGHPEFILLRHTDVLEGAEQAQGEVLTRRDGAVVAYGPADGIVADDARDGDGDGDGRPDLVTSAPYPAEGGNVPLDQGIPARARVTRAGSRAPRSRRSRAPRRVRRPVRPGARASRRGWSAPRRRSWS